MADTVKIVESCTFYVVHPDSKKLVSVTFYVATNDGSVLLSCKTTLALHIIQPRSILVYLPPWASLITSTMDHPKKTRQASLKVHSSKQEVSAQMQEVQGQATTSLSTNTVQKPGMNMLVTSKKQILSSYPDIFEGIGRFPVPLYHIQVAPNVTLKQTQCRPVPVNLKEVFKKEVDKILKAGIIKPVQETAPWINSFMLVEGKDRLGHLKLCICLDPTNLNKAAVREPYHFKTPEDIAHLIANCCIMMVCNCKKGYWHQELDEASSFLTTFNTELGRFWYTVKPFGITVAEDVFQ